MAHEYTTWAAAGKKCYDLEQFLPAALVTLNSHEAALVTVSVFDKDLSPYSSN